VVILGKEYINFAWINDHQLFFPVDFKINSLLWLINASDKFESYLILEVDCEMSQEKYTFFDDSHVSFKNELIFEVTIDILQKMSLFTVFQRRFFHFCIFLLYIILHPVAQLSTKMVVIF